MKLETIDYRAADSAKHFVESLRETGFGVLSNHPIDKELVGQAFFNSDAKNEFMFNRETHDGFFPASISETAKGHTVKDIKEYYHVYPWGRIPDSLRANILAYYEKANALAAELLEWIETYSPDEVKAKFSIPLPEMIADSHKTLLRILHYPPMTGDEEMGAIRAAAHEDINLITVLPAANEPGLQVKAKDGSWLDVPSDFGNIIINIGDMLQEASGGYFPSLPLFLHPKPSVVLSERYTADSYLMERLRELGVL